MEMEMRTLSEQELYVVAGGWPNEPPSPSGNNGWGNGAEGTNPGSDDGGTAGSKIDESWDGASDGPRPSKFDTR
jgi:hypothetical protein